MATAKGEPHEQRVMSAISSSASAKSALVASWRRSAALHHLDPTTRQQPLRVSDVEVNEARQALGNLVACAQPSLDRLFAAVGGVGCCVLLANKHGVSLERRGASSDDPTFKDWGLWTGTIWSEDREGTNGIGTCIVEQRVVTIHRDQHFYTRNTSLSCTTAPIHDHLGQLLAVLDVSSCRADLTEGFLGLITQAVTDAARRIEAESFRLAFPKARIILAPTTDQRADALLAVDRDDLVIGATKAARQALGISGKALESPIPATDLLADPRSPDEEIAMAERGALQRALARAGGNVSAAATALGMSRATLHRKLNRLGLRAAAH